MRGGIYGGLLLLLLMACKPIARQPVVSDLMAVSDGKMTLGVVPAENGEGLRAYRLLVCRQSASYPKWMLEDTNRCRHALMAADGREVVFLQDDLKRDFATKYAGHAKGMIVPALVAVAAVAGGAWVIKQNFIASRLEGVKTFFDKAKNKVVTVVPERFKNVDLKLNWIEAPRAQWRHLFNKLQQQGIDTINRVPGVNIVTDLPKATREQGIIVEQSEEVLRWQKTKRTLNKMKKLSGDTEGYNKFVDDLTAEGYKLNGVEELVLGVQSQDGSFLKANAAVRRQAKAVFKTDELTDDSLKTVDNYLNDLTKYNDILRIMYVKGTSVDGLDDAIKRVDDKINKARTALDKLKADREYSPIAGVKLSTLKSVGGAVAAGVGVYAVQTMTALDKSIWGYGDRQVSAHWSQIFHEGDLADAKDGADIRKILQTIADTFGYRVNEEALILGR